MLRQLRKLMLPVFGRERSKQQQRNISLCCGRNEKFSESAEVRTPFTGSDKSTKELLEGAATFTADKDVEPGDVWHSNTYGPNRKAIMRSQGLEEESGINPDQTSIFLFPGQGTQFVGMGRDLLDYPNVKNLYETASEILGYNLLKLCLEGPIEELSRTDKQQSAVLVSSLAAVERIREENPEALEQCTACAGFSVGEITALTFAGSINFEDAVRLVRIRGEAMQIASDMVPSGMMTVFYGADSRLGFACKVAKEYCHRNEIDDADCRIANYLYPHCKVIAGNQEALQFIDNNKNEFGLRKLKRLSVSGAFHTDLMKPAAEVFKEAFKEVNVNEPAITVISNYNAKKYTSTRDIKSFLPKQIYSPVRWEQTMHVLYERSMGQEFPRTYECGPGRSLKTILKMVNEKAWEKCSNSLA